MQPRGRQRRRRTLLALPIIGLLLSACVVTLAAGPAAAAGCSGNLVGHHPVRTPEGELMAHVDVYYSSNGWNCVRLNSYGDHWGQHKYMSLEVATCRQTVDPGNTCTPLDSGNSRYYGIDSDWYSYYAGPIKVYAPNRCIAWAVNIMSYEDGVAQTRGAGHCG